MISSPSSRLILTYQGATYHRARNSLAIAGVMILIILLVRFPHQTPPPGAVAGPPTADILLGLAAFFCITYAIVDGLFVAGTRYGGEKSCDTDNLYIDQQGEETVIPLDTITTIRPGANGMGNNTRGPFKVYMIEYNYNGISRSEDISVYIRNQDNFNLFRERVQRKNPSVEIRKWSTPLDGIIGLFASKAQRK